MNNLSLNNCIDRSVVSQSNEVSMWMSLDDQNLQEEQKNLLGSALSRSRSSSSNSSSYDEHVDRFKTELCHNFMENNGNCRYGTRCKFAHGKEEMRQIRRHPKFKTVRCKSYYETGSCPYGHRCNFIHDDQPALTLLPPPQPSILLSYTESIRTILKSKAAALEDKVSFSTNARLNISGGDFQQFPIARPTSNEGFRIPDLNNNININNNNEDCSEFLYKIFLNTSSSDMFSVPPSKQDRLSIFRQIVPSA